MSRKQLVGWLQNLALVLLTALALFLLTRLFLLQGGWPAQVQATLDPQSAPAERPAVSGRLGQRFTSVHLMVTGDSKYGRYGRLYVTGEDPQLQQLSGLFREALGSASDALPASDEELRAALAEPGLYLGLTTTLPLAAVAAWLDEEEAPFDITLYAMALTTGSADTASLYLLDREEGILRCATALPASAVRTLCQDAAPNGSQFLWESDTDLSSSSLDPYTILVAQSPAPEDVTAELPGRYTAYNLLTALDFNAYTTSRYTETSSGVEVVEESPRTVRIGPDGTVAYTGGAAVPELYLTGGSGLNRALQGACRLAEALTSGTGATDLYLCGAQEEEDGWVLRFRYQVDGIPVRFSDEGDALSVTVSGGVITAFTYRCRSYTPVEAEGASPQPLLPPTMAAAIAAGYSDPWLSIGYVDAGAGRLRAQWLGD